MTGKKNKLKNRQYTVLRKMRSECGKHCKRSSLVFYLRIYAFGFLINIVIHWYCKQAFVFYQCIECCFSVHSYFQSKVSNLIVANYLGRTISFVVKNPLGGNTIGPHPT